MIAAVFDCVVYIQAALSAEGPAAACLSSAESGHVKLFVTSAILAECRETLSKQKLRVRFSKLSDERVESFLHHIGEVAELIQEVASTFSLGRDPDDAMYVDLAVATRAGFLVTRDKDLLSLMMDDTFRTEYPGLTVIEPASFLALVRSERANEPGRH